MNIKYTISGDGELDSILTFLANDSENDPRYEYNVGDIVTLDGPNCLDAVGDGIFQIRYRRNGYPPPWFDCWFPLYYLERLNPKTNPDKQLNGGETGPNGIKPLR